MTWPTVLLLLCCATSLLSVLLVWIAWGWQRKAIKRLRDLEREV